MSSPTFADPTTRVRLRRQALAWRRVADDVVLLDIDRSRYHAVNAAGAVLWEALENGTTVGALTDALTRTYPSASDRAVDDVRRFLTDLDDRAFLEIDGAAPTAGSELA